MPAPLVFLLLSCSLSLSGAALVLENGLPILWGHALAQLTDFPITEGALTPDAWHYLHRMGFFRLLIAATDPYLSSMGPGENQNPMWGMPLRLGWMLTSGRLADPTGATVCGTQNGDTPDMCISPNSWWSCMHYYSSVLPFLSAAKNGFFGENVVVVVQNPSEVEGYCTTYDTCKTAHADLMASWDAFFQSLKNCTSSTLPDSEKKDIILGLYWKAQVQSWHQGFNTLCGDKLNSYPAMEKSFAENYMIGCEYSAAAHFHSNLELSTPFIAPLPGRVLKDGDNAPNIADLTAQENHMIYSLAWMKSLDSSFWGSLRGMWRKFMCSAQARESGRDMLHKLMLNPAFPTTSFVSLMMKMTTCSDQTRTAEGLSLESSCMS